MHIVKKLFPLVLILCLLLAAVSPAFTASAETVYYPNVHLRGNGAEIIDEDGNVVYDFDVSMDQVKAIAKRVLPLLLKNDLDAYYRAFGEEMAKLYDRALLDENGEPKYGTNIAAKLLQDNEVAMTQNRVRGNGSYAISAYTFWYDWRLDPLETADDLAVYIDGILAATGKDKINLNGACLGSTILLAYLSKYGSDKLNAIGFQHAVGFGCELVDETFSGKINIDADAVERFACYSVLMQLPQERPGKAVARACSVDYVYLVRGSERPGFARKGVRAAAAAGVQQKPDSLFKK